jgi:hypothetical protein
MLGDVPFAPWFMRGESIVGLARLRDRRSLLPEGLVAMPGPALILATRFTESPVGPYLRLAVAEPARLGMRPGWTLTTVIVDSARARMGERLNWGIPAEVGTLRWFQRDEERRLTWEEHDASVRVAPHGPRFPVVVPLRSLQERRDGPVVVPGRIGGMARLGPVTVSAYPGDDLGWATGRHRGFLVTGLSQVVREARHPVGLRATLLAPLRAPGAAFSGKRGAVGCSPDPGRIAQLARAHASHA